MEKEKIDELVRLAKETLAVLISGSTSFRLQTSDKTNRLEVVADYTGENNVECNSCEFCKN